MASGHKAQKDEESGLKSVATTTAADAGKVDPIEEEERKKVLDLQNFFSGKSGPVDVRKIPYGGAAISLYNDQKLAHDAGRKGLGYGSLVETANPNFVAAREQEAQMDRDTEASGELENYVADTENSVSPAALNLAGRSDDRRRYLAELAQRRLDAFYNRPQRGSFLKDLATAGTTAAISAI